jgi:monoamine oxidase
VEAVREELTHAKERDDGSRPGEAGAGPGRSRREFLAVGAAAAAAGLASWKRARAQVLPAASGGTRVAIIGGGLSGMAAAITLTDHGITPTIYEGALRTGGRIFTDRPGQPGCGVCHSVARPVPSSTWAGDQYCDPYGEMVDTDHVTMFALAKRFNLPMDDLEADRPPGHLETYYFGGSYFRQPDVDAAWARIRPQLMADLRAARYPSTWDRMTNRGKELDNMSVRQWLQKYVEQLDPSDARLQKLSQLLDIAYNVEYGAETTDQSSLNMIYMLAYGPSRTLSVIGSSDERWRVRGGADALPTAMAHYLRGEPGTVPPLSVPVTINPGWRLEAIALRSDGAYDLTFAADRTRTVVADYVILAFPFQSMRNLVDYSRAGFDARKIQAIKEQGASHNGKLHLQFKHRLWLDNRPDLWGLCGGDAYADTGFQCTWEATRAQPRLSPVDYGILVDYTGGNVADSMYLKHPYGDTSDNRVIRDAQRFLTQIEPVWPGMTALWNSRASNSLAHLDPLLNCSYAYWRVGQYQKFVGYERVPQGNVYFAGDHTSVDMLGYMEGAAIEGIRAGNEVARALGR